MITYFDEEGLINPQQVADTVKATDIDTAITAFSDFLFDELCSSCGAVRMSVRQNAGGVYNHVFVIEKDGKRVIVYKSPVGAPAAAMAMEEISALGVKNFVAFGICGALVDVPPRTFIVPDKAFRDEGTSYHYTLPSEYVAVKNSGYIDRALAALNVSTLVGGTWTTDGFYRETRTRAEQMKRAGCVAVDMECSALQTVCDYRGKNFYTFFISADSLAGDEWSPNDILELSVMSAHKTAVAAAVKIAFGL